MENDSSENLQRHESQYRDESSHDSLETNLWKHPITWVALTILATTILLIGANVLGLDKGHTLERLARIDFARGLITYLFAVGTIGVIITVILSALLSQGSADEKIRRAKDILSILIGI